MATNRDGRAKHPTTPLAGPYGHPFHPMLVTIPIGAWVLSFVFDLVSQWAGEAEVFTKSAFWLLVAGIVAAVVAALFGLMDLAGIPSGTRAKKMGITHLILNDIVLVLYVINALIRRGGLDDGPVDLLPIVLSVAALVLLAGSGWIGGELAYRYGVRVADEETQAAGFR